MPPPTPRTLRRPSSQPFVHRACVHRACVHRRVRVASASASSAEGKSTREMLAELRSLHVNTESLFDRESVVEAWLAHAPKDTPPPGDGRGEVACDHVAPIAWRQAASLFAGIKTQQGSYAALELSFDDSGKRGTFVVDTAASNTIILPASSARLDAVAVGGPVGAGLGGTGTTQGGRRVSLGPVRLTDKASTSIPLAPPGLQAVEMEVPTGNDTDGILGIDMLNQLDAIEWTWAKDGGTMRCWPLRALERPSWDKLHAGLEDCSLTSTAFGLLLVKIHVNGIEMPALLDTGACFTTFNSAASQACGLEIDPTIEPMWVAGAGGSPVSLGVGGHDVSISVGSSKHAPISDIRPLIGDLPALSQLGLPNSAPGVLLGLDVLMQRPRVVVSTSWRRLWL